MPSRTVTWCWSLITDGSWRRRRTFSRWQTLPADSAEATCPPARSQAGDRVHQGRTCRRRDFERSRIRSGRNESPDGGNSRARALPDTGSPGADSRITPRGLRAHHEFSGRAIVAVARGWRTCSSFFQGFEPRASDPESAEGAQARRDAQLPRTRSVSVDPLQTAPWNASALRGPLGAWTRDLLAVPGRHRFLPLARVQELRPVGCGGRVGRPLSRRHPPSAGFRRQFSSAVQLRALSPVCERRSKTAAESGSQGP